MTPGLYHPSNCCWPAPQSHKWQFTLTTYQKTFLYSAIGRETSDRVTQPVQRGINVDVAGTKIGKIEVFGDPAWYPRPVKRWWTKNARCATMWAACAR